MKSSWALAWAQARQPRTSRVTRRSPAPRSRYSRRTASSRPPTTTAVGGASVAPLPRPSPADPPAHRRRRRARRRRVPVATSTVMPPSSSVVDTHRRARARPPPARDLPDGCQPDARQVAQAGQVLHALSDRGRVPELGVEVEEVEATEAPDLLEVVAHRRPRRRHVVARPAHRVLEVVVRNARQDDHRLAVRLQHPRLRAVLVAPADDPVIPGCRRARAAYASLVCSCGRPQADDGPSGEVGDDRAALGRAAPAAASSSCVAERRGDRAYARRSRSPPRARGRAPGCVVASDVSTKLVNGTSTAASRVAISGPPRTGARRRARSPPPCARRSARSRASPSGVRLVHASAFRTSTRQPIGARRRRRRAPRARSSATRRARRRTVARATAVCGEPSPRPERSIAHST